MKKIYTVLLVFLFLTSCVSPVKLNPDQMRQVHSVDLSNNIIVPANFVLHGRGAVITYATGRDRSSLVGQLVKYDIDNEGQNTDLSKARANAFSAMLFTQFKQQLYAKKHITISPTSPVKMKIKILDNSYGYMSTGLGFGNKLRPVVMIQVTLLKNNTVIWREWASVKPTGPIKAYSEIELRNNPKLIISQWQQASKLLAAEIIEKMN